MTEQRMVEKSLVYSNEVVEGYKATISKVEE